MSIDLSVTVSRHIEAGAREIFRSWVDPEHARHWFFTAPDSHVTACDIDARPGGGFRVVDERAERTILHVGEFVELDLPNRLQFRYAAGENPRLAPRDSAEVVVTIIPEDTGHRVTLVQRLPEDWAPHEEAVRADWERALAALAAHLGVWVERTDAKPFDGGLA